MATPRIRAINDAICANDVPRLCALGRSGDGFVSDGLRRLAWPVVLAHLQASANDAIGNEVRAQTQASLSSAHRDSEQVGLDVHRVQSGSAAQLRDRPRLRNSFQRSLGMVALHVLNANPALSYYQGFHDVCAVLTDVCGPTSAMPVADQIARFYLGDAMRDSLKPIQDQLQFIYPLVTCFSSKLGDFLRCSEAPPEFAISWVLTWFAHDVTGDPGLVHRLFDLFISSNPLMPVYVAAALVLDAEDEILRLDCDFPTVHTFLKSRATGDNVSKAIPRAVRLYSQHPPRKLQKIVNLDLGVQSVVNVHCTLMGIHDVDTESRYVAKGRWLALILASMAQRRRQFAIGAVAAAVASVLYYWHSR